MFGTILKNLRIDHELTQKEFADILKITKSAVSNYEAGRRKPDYEMLEQIADFFNVDIAYLMGKQKKKHIEIYDNMQTIKSSPCCTYDQLPLSVAAGSPWDYESGDKFDKIEIPDVLLGKYAGKKTIGVAKVNGESMNKDIPNGSWIIIDRAKNELNMLKNRDIVLVRDSAGYTVKRIIISHNEVILKPNSTFDEFRDIVVNETNKHDYRLVGKVVKALIDFDEQ
ncbi:helix-turn-helix domain-containing protein [Peptostreptococcus faecalis]|uniref:helix-turn-helix domain-containing protein n=1 Tax=Peptostreptococcus faecalis TaxID=2045015 RepID=UPI0015E086F6|nr:XRE family transcriptional regulator [Peptostreptococcus faecalis]